MRFPNPLFQGDTVHVTTEVVGKRESKSRPDAGIVEFEHKCFNQHDTLVAICRRQAFMKKRRPDVRSLLFVPGDSPKKLDKALRAGADALILDLEDSVAAGDKEAARRTALAFLQEQRGASRRGRSSTCASMRSRRRSPTAISTSS